MKIMAKENDINNMQLSYKHWVSSKNHHTCMSATNEDFDPEEHYISSFFITCDLCFRFR